MAIVDLGEKAADKLLKQGRIKIGWVFCRVRRRTMVPRCYKFLGYGHSSKSCQGPDRSDLCYKCGKSGHKAKYCSAPECCVLCKGISSDPVELGNIPRTGPCKVFREDLEKARKSPK